ncbi:MAG: 30S ribosomal protein S18 [Candidatus Omnitrophica bacterium]|nr:30S ribosomal protein S18 [Candidatus Omnitrophota bacterium]
MKRDMIDKKQKKVVRLKKKCLFCKENLVIDYKDVDLLSRFINVKGRITSRRVNGNCAKHQRKMSREIKRARFLALLPYVSK